MSEVPGLPNPATANAAESPAVEHLPWSTVPVHLGPAGLVLSKAVDALDPMTELARLTNAVPHANGGLVTRPGLDPLFTGLISPHTFSRLNDPPAHAFTRFIGDGTTWKRGIDGVPELLEDGFSGDPVAMVPWQTDQSGESWMYVADSVKMRKASRTGPSLPIGLPKPTVPIVTANERISVRICTFSSIDATQASAWVPFAGLGSGYAIPRPPGYTGAVSTPTLANVAAPGSGNGVEITYNPGTSNGGFASGMGLPRALDLSGGTLLTDEDIFHIWIRISDYNACLDEVRIYFVCSAFSMAPPWMVPGSGHPTNKSAYMRSFRGSDYSRALLVMENVQDAATRVRTATFLDGYGNPPISDRAPHVHQNPSQATNASPGEWAEMGHIGFPIRRSEFTKIGLAGTTGCDWSTITGIFVVVTTTAASSVKVAFADSFLTGGFKPDSSEPDAFSYDYRVTNVDKRTGAESNPSDDYIVWDGAVKTGGVDLLRQAATITVSAYGDSHIYQRAYRRGGTLGDNWFGPVGDNEASGDGTPITDNMADLTAVSAGTLQTDHDQPVTTAAPDGSAIYAQPVPVLFGPLDGYLFALGDPYRPGDVYWTRQDQPDHWPAFNHRQVCPPSERLMNGGMYGSQLFVFSLERMYALHIQDGHVTSDPTDCAHGLAGRWAFDVGQYGIGFVATDGIYLTTGGTAKLLSEAIRPLFHNQEANGYHPIDWTQSSVLRIEFHGDDLWFGYYDTTGCNVWMIYSFTYDRWRAAIFEQEIHGIYSEPQDMHGLSLLLGGFRSTKAYLHDGFTDDGAVIRANARTASTDFGKGREEKLLGDIVVWGESLGGGLTVQPYYNGEAVAGVVQSVTGAAIYSRYIFDAFGTEPMHAQTAALDFTWNGVADATPRLQRAGIAVAVQPEMTLKRVTTWHPLHDSGEAWVQGCWIDADTYGQTKTLLVEGLRNGQPTVVANLSLTSSAGRKEWFSWPTAFVDMIRIRPTSDQPWELFGQGWLWRPEPPQLVVWDSGFEAFGDTYWTGLDLDVDTFGQTKQIVVEIDGVTIGTYPVTANGRRYVHITLPNAPLIGSRGHIYHFYSIDAFPGKHYTHTWQLDKEPSEQTNWNENFTTAGTRADKWLKGFTIECDTFGQDKTVTIEIDGQVVETVTVNTTGRRIQHVAFPQHLGRVFRLWPTDTHPGRRYSFGWIFDEEPFQLTRFETQEQRHTLDEWHTVTYGQLTYKASSDVTLVVTAYGQAAKALAVDTYTLADTHGAKGMVPFKPKARKGVLFKYVFTSPSGFWLYREESWIETRGWNSGQVSKQHVFGNDDLDPSRNMVDAQGAAAAPGGMAV
ncbi:MAG TPA: hypothetical protein VFO16_24095 [Pseudonocardiaceae bacterium]|nr:hypothetical protein [Pseudonocardiaceae bacterium]